jgi:2TM domain-containing protein
MTDQNERRQAAIKRVEAKRAFRFHAALYAAVNLLLIVVWALTGARYFWPIWPILGWGIGVAFHYWAVFQQKPISEDEIRREMERGP